MDPFMGMMVGNIGGSLLGGLFGRQKGPSAGQLQMMMLQRIENMYREQGVRRELAFRDATAQKQDLLTQGLADFDLLGNRVTGSSQNAQRQTVAAGERNKADATQALTSRGMGNSTIGQQAKNQINAFTTQGVQALQNQEADRLNAVTQAKGAFRSTMGNDIAELPIRNLGFSQADTNALANILSNVQFQQQSNKGAGIGGQIGSLIGLGLSGGFGGMFGGGGLGPQYGPGGMGPPNPNAW